MIIIRCLGDIIYLDSNFAKRAGRKLRLNCGLVYDEYRTFAVSHNGYHRPKQELSDKLDERYSERDITESRRMFDDFLNSFNGGSVISNV